MRNAEHGRLANRRVLVEHLLDLARIDVVTAADDHVLLAVDDEEVAVLVDLAHVAGVQPAVADRLGGRVLALPVALHHVVAPDHDLADLALRDLVAVVVDDLHLDALDRSPDRAGLALAVGVVERGDRRGLREAVALEDLASERVLESAHQLDRHRRAARGAQLQGRGVELLVARVVQHRPVHRRDALEDVDLVALDDLERLAGVEARDQRQRATAADRRVHRSTSDRTSETAAARRASSPRNRSRTCRARPARCAAGLRASARRPWACRSSPTCRGSRPCRRRRRRRPR